MTPDGDWVVDQAAGLPGYFVIGGDNVGGLSTAPALGADLAQWIGAGGPRPASLEPYRLDRFAAADLDEQGLRARCLATYVTRYGRRVTVG
jgi:glycine/D-amino acid oxidase-like deaminating enzyme